MREIKFRFWNKNEKKMHNNVYVKWLSPDISEYNRYKYRDFGDVHHLGINTAINNHKDYEIMQYTGLKDKNGKEIYEGDIVNVVFNDGTKYDNPNQVYYEHGAFAVGMGYLHDTNDIEVIGNIYENP